MIRTAAALFTTKGFAAASVDQVGPEDLLLELERFYLNALAEPASKRRPRAAGS